MHLIIENRGVARNFEWGDETPKASTGMGLGDRQTGGQTLS